MDEWVPGRILEVLKLNDTSHNSPVCLWSKSTYNRWKQQQEPIKLSWRWQESWQDSDFDFTHKQIDTLFVRLVDSGHLPFRMRGFRMIKRWIGMALNAGIRIGEHRDMLESSKTTLTLDS